MQAERHFRRELTAALVGCVVFVLTPALTSAQCREFLSRGRPILGFSNKTLDLDGDMLIDQDEISVRVGGTWIPQAVLSTQPYGQGNFGWSVAIEGDRAVVGAPAENDWEGAVYLFQRAGTSWALEQRLGGLGNLGYASFGDAVALSGDTLAASQPYRCVGNPGNVRIFVRGPSGWTEEAMLTSSDKTPCDYFGQNLALVGDVLVVGAWNAPASAGTTGAAYVFERDAGVWSQTQKLVPSDPLRADNFGWALAFDGSTIAVGRVTAQPAYAWDPGAVFVYTRSGGLWSEEAMLVPSQSFGGDDFGGALSCEQDRLIVGASWNSAASYGGRAHLFERSAGGWTEQAAFELGCVTPTKGDFGWCVALSDGRAAVTDHLGWVALYDLAAGSACASARNGLNTNPVFYSASLPRVGSTWTAVVDSRAHPGATSTLILGYSDCIASAPSPFGEVLIALGSARLFTSMAVPVQGEGVHSVPIPSDPALVGLSAASQAAILGGTPAIELGNAIDLVIGA